MKPRNSNPTGRTDGPRKGAKNSNFYTTPGDATGGSRYVDPHEEEKVAFKDLPNRFPSVLSRDFRRDQKQYKDFNNLFAMYLFYNLARYGVGIGNDTRQLAIEEVKIPMGYPEAAAAATESARSDSRKFLGGAPFRPRGKSLGEGADERTC